jgi:hypothetical protein
MSNAHNSGSNSTLPEKALSDPISKSLEKNELINRNIFKDCYDCLSVYSNFRTNQCFIGLFGWFGGYQSIR